MDKKKIINDTSEKEIDKIEIEEEVITSGNGEERPGIGYEIFGIIGSK